MMLTRKFLLTNFQLIIIFFHSFFFRFFLSWQVSVTVHYYFRLKVRDIVNHRTSTWCDVMWLDAKAVFINWSNSVKWYCSRDCHQQLKKALSFKQKHQHFYSVRYLYLGWVDANTDLTGVALIKPPPRGQ